MRFRWSFQRFPAYAFPSGCLSYRVLFRMRIKPKESEAKAQIKSAQAQRALEQAA